MRLFWSLLMFACLLPAVSHAEEASREAFAALLDTHWQRTLQERPVFASMIGERGYDDRWTDLRARALENSHRADRAELRQLQRIDATKLAPEAAIDHDLLRRELTHRIAMFQLGQHLMPMTQLSGVQTYDQLPAQLRFATLEDYDHWLARLESLDAHLAQTIELMRQGLRRGLVVPQVAMRRVPTQIRALLVETPEESGFYRPFDTLPEEILPARADALRAAARATLSQKVLPAYRRLHDFLVEEYLPAAREDIALQALPNGEGWYRTLAAWHTSTELTTREIHEIGKREVVRILEAMQEVMEATGFEGDLQEFFNWLREDPSHYYEDEDQLLKAYRATAKRIDPTLPRLFSRLPRIPYGVLPIPASIAPDTYAAYYQPPAADGSRAGYFFVNLYRPETRPKFEIEVLTVHEAVPGHHLQIALAMELDAHPFRRHQRFTAYTEGWALYAEGLGEELGLYQDPLSLFGRLTYDMWRAVRLVVDTGMHSMGWPRDRAIAYMTDHTPRALNDITNEIDRYIAWPGQALAYKAGELRILALRERAERRLGADFDIRAFHDVILSGGALPLDLLEARVDAWIARQLEPAPGPAAGDAA